MRKMIPVIMLLMFTAMASAELQLTISGPDELAVNETATYTVSYSGVSLICADFDLIADANGNISVVDPPWCGGPICPAFEAIVIPDGRSVSICNDQTGTALDAVLCTLNLTATGTAGEVMHLSMIENSFFDLSWEPVTGAVLPALDVTIVSGTSSCTVPNEVNVPLADANAAIVAAGFTVGTITNHSDNDIPAGNVISTTPAGGIEADCGSSVAIDVSTGPCLYIGRVFSGPGITTLTITQTHIDRWNALGKPNCWCCDSQKRGNGVYTPPSTACKVDAIDLAKIKNSNQWHQVLGSPGYNANPCSDMNLSGKIDAIELAKIKHTSNWNQLVGCGPPCE